MKPEEILNVFKEYEFSGKMENEAIKESFTKKYGLKERRSKIAFIADKIKDIVELFS